MWATRSEQESIIAPRRFRSQRTNGNNIPGPVFASSSASTPRLKYSLLSRTYANKWFRIQIWSEKSAQIVHTVMHRTPCCGGPSKGSLGDACAHATTHSTYHHRDMCCSESCSVECVVIFVSRGPSWRCRPLHAVSVRCFVELTVG